MMIKELMLHRQVLPQDETEGVGRLLELEIDRHLRMKAEEIDLREFFGPAEAETLISMSWSVNIMDLLMAQRALTALLKGWGIERERRYRPEGPQPVERLAVEVAPGRFDFLLRHGCQFWRGPDGGRMVIDIWVDEERKCEDCDLIFSIPRRRYEWLRKLLPRLRRWMDGHHFLRRQSFDATGHFLRPEPVDWNDVVLPPALEGAIRRNCIDLLGHRRLYIANGVPLRRGIVLHGPPGTGKTLIGRALARHCGVTFILSTPGMLEEGKDVRRVFEWGRRFAPTILFFEDFDLVARDRYDGGRGEIVGEFLSCLDGIDSKGGIITIATTNNLKAIEPALRDRPNRFDCVLEVPPMRLGERERFLKRWRVRHGGDFDAHQWARRTRRFTGAQMNELCRLAVFEAIEDRVAAGGRRPERLPLGDTHFARAIERFPRKANAPIGFVVGRDDE